MEVEIHMTPTHMGIVTKKDDVVERDFVMLYDGMEVIQRIMSEENHATPGNEVCVVVKMHHYKAEMDRDAFFAMTAMA